jgi:hypothetical protein
MSVPHHPSLRVKHRITGLACGSLLLFAAACESLPGEKRQQGAVIGGVSGAAAGAILADEDHRLLGAVIGGALGAGGGYLIGRRMEGEEQPPTDSQRQQITKEQVAAATTADIDRDGNVTLAEIVAMEAAGLTDEEIIRRLEATSMVFALNDEQERTLTERGVSRKVIERLETLNRVPDQVSAPKR